MDKVIIIDASGSMGEGGKKSVVRYLIQAITGIMEERYSDKHYEMFCWSNQIVSYDGKTEFSGKAEAKALETFLNAHQKDTVLLIGDGSYSEDVKRIVKPVIDNIMCLMVGSDCNRGRFMKIASPGHLYEAVDVVACMDDFINHP